MKLLDAIPVTRGEKIAFVGAGGKTAAMFRLASELVEQGWQVVSTTTTRLAQEEINHVPFSIALGDDGAIPDTFSETLTSHRHVFLFSRVDPSGKVLGFSSEWVDRSLGDLGFSDAVLIEADGSRRLPLKAPLPHEPVIPQSVSTVIVVAGLSALGLPLTPEAIYGAEGIHALTGHPLGEPVTGQLMADILSHPAMGLNNIPSHARVIVLLNQVGEQNLDESRRVAADVLRQTRIESVVLAALADAQPVWEVRHRLGVIILAAGQSTRMGQPKMLLPWGSSTIVRHVGETMLRVNPYEVVVVAGPDADAIRDQLSGLPIRVIQTAAHQDAEMIASLQTGLRELQTACHACMVVLGDQPEIDPAIVSMLMDCYAQGKGKIVAPSYQHRRGHPVIFDRDFWPAIMELPPTAAPRDLLRAREQAIFHLTVDNDSVLRDIDTPEEYRQALNR